MCLSAFNFSFRTHNYTSATCQICFAYPTHTIYISASREIRCFDKFHQFLYRNFRIINICITCFNHFRKIMRRHIGSHTNSNTGCSVHQKVRDTRRHHLRFHQCIIKVRFKINGFLIQVIHHCFTQLIETSFCITHSSRAITIHRTKVSLSIYQRITHCPFLRHTYHCKINRRIPMRMILTKYLTHDSR